MSREMRGLDAVVEELVRAGLLHPRPRAMGVRGWSLLLPSVIQVAGLCAFGAVAWAFTEAGSLSQSRITLVIVGSFSIAVGGGIGSLPVTVECFRKGLHSWADWCALVVSGVASLVETFVALSFLGGFEIANSIPRIAAMSLLAVLDACFGMAEFGQYLAGHDDRLGEWKQEYDVAVKQYYSLPTPATYAVATGKDAYTKPLPQSNGDKHVCPYCGTSAGRDGRPFKSSQAVSAHLRGCEKYQVPVEVVK
ncbi:MAG: hypothetical protein SXV54_26665 [Chloroflexota bacterium]|nr:hypothetical protein [Chloroflexota bacterium]